jgi:hypothetical protein
MIDKKKVAREILKAARELAAGSRDAVKTRHVKLEIVDWTGDEDEPAYDVNVWIDGKPVTGGKGVFSAKGGEEAALRKAEAFMDRLVKALVRESGGAF